MAGFEDLVESASIRCGGFWAGDMALVSIWRKTTCTMLLLLLNIKIAREGDAWLWKREVRCG